LKKGETPMTDFSTLLEGIATIAWPGIVILILFLFRPAVAVIIESAKSRKFTLKLGGQELTMEEANEQQRTLIVDLQTQILEIKKTIKEMVDPAMAEPETVRAKPPSTADTILWVDDQPKNNSFFVQQLSDKRVKVDLAMSTSEGLRLFDQKTFGAVISNMGRTENSKYIPNAGLELLKEIRDRNKTIPFIIFCGSRGVRQNKNTAMGLGATAITASPTEMSGILQTAIEESDG
jgi:CheY-like chemotaxis protein